MDHTSNDPADLLNQSLSTTFDIDKKEVPQQLGVRNQGRVNRTLVTRYAVSSTSFTASLNSVQYGTYMDESACLVAIDFSFSFHPRVASRYSYAYIKCAFTKAADVRRPAARNPNTADDPRVKNMAPKEVYGIVKTIEEKKVRDVTIPVMFESPIGLSAGLEGHVGQETIEHQENRMEIHGRLSYDDDDHEEANIVIWELYENPAQRDGIFRDLRVVIIVSNPSGQPMWMKVTVKPSVKFSVDPRRLFEKNDPFARLVQKNDDPVLLDGKTAKLGPVEVGSTDFSAPQFPWGKILWLPTEYKVANSLLTLYIVFLKLTSS
jgi:hypothetical protein